MDGELMDFDAIRAEFTCDSIAQTAFGVVVFNGDDEVVGLLRGFAEEIFGERFDAVGVNYGNSGPFVLEGVGCFEGFEQGCAGSDDSNFVPGGLAENFCAADGELLVVVINDRGFRA